MIVEIKLQLVSPKPAAAAGMIVRIHKITGFTMLEHSSNQFEQRNSTIQPRNQFGQIDQAGAFTNSVHAQRAFQIAKEMCRQAAVLAKATELRLEVEVRRTYTTLQCELMNGESTKERNAIYGLPKTVGAPQRFTNQPTIDWFELAQKILIRNEVALELGYSTISNLKSLTDAYNSATRAYENLRSYELQISAYA